MRATAGVSGSTIWLRVDSALRETVRQRRHRTLESLVMNVTTKPLDALLPVASLGKPVPKAPDIQDGGFLDAMKQALTTTTKLQSESGRLSREVTFGNPTVGLEETMLAGVKSNIAFQATLQTRNRIVQAYTDVMNMQV